MSCMVAWLRALGGLIVGGLLGVLVGGISGMLLFAATMADTDPVFATGHVLGCAALGGLFAGALGLWLALRDAPPQPPDDPPSQ